MELVFAMTRQEKRRKRLIIRWTAPKGFAAMLLFLALAFLLEYLIIISFLSTGITDNSTWMETFQVPYVNWSFTLTVSPLLHLLPLSVVIVLISSWIFLTKQIAFIPQRIGSAKRAAIRRRRPQRRRLEFVRNFSSDNRDNPVVKAYKSMGTSQMVKLLNNANYLCHFLSFLC